jgi:gluconate kinase
LESFFYVLKRYEERKSHNMLCLMLNSRFMNLRLISSFISREEGLSIVEKYDK